MEGAEIRIRVLGAIEATCDGEDLALGGTQQRRLLAVLTRRMDEVVDASVIAEALWHDGSLPEDWRGSLRVAVSRLRSTLGPSDSIVSVGPGYRLVAAVDSVDASRVDLLVNLARNSGDEQERRAAYESALGEFGGDAYAEFAGEAWIEPEARRLDEIRLVIVEEWADLVSSTGSASVAVPELERWVVSHPLREGLRRRLMEALAASGRTAEALEVYQDYRRQLASGVGLDPTPELRGLEQRILVGDERVHTTLVEQLRGYELGERIGEGAFSVVYRGRQPAVEREVAIKVIRSELANRPEFIRRFEAEAHMVAHLEHPHIVPLYDYWREPDRAYLVMRWLRGGSLESRLDKGPLSVEIVALVAEQIGAALTVAHRAGVVHRDVKSANILLDEDDNAYLTDFGIALETAELETPEAALSAGSPAYASPEQLRRQPVGPTTDVHGLAIALYEALTGTLPFPNAADQAALLQHQLHDPLPPPSVRAPQLGARVDEVLARATEKDPDKRYQDVDTFVEQLLEALNFDAPVSGSHPSSRATLVDLHALANPYKGLRAFQEADTSDFYGRERLVDELIAHLDGGETSNRFLSVVGPSGSGKSSVVRAGLLPALRTGAISGSDDWFYVTMVPGIDPYEELETALLRVAVNPPSSLRDQLIEDRRGILRAVKRILPDDESELVLVIDQFEELFTLAEAETTRARFLEALVVAVTDASSPFRVVTTLRADFYDRPLRYESMARLMRSSSVTVTPLAADELEHAIVDPVTPLGFEFEPGLVSQIVADVASQPGALPLLQYAMTLLFERHRSGMLTRQAYQDLGGVTGALASRAEDLYEGSSEVERVTIRRVFGRLVSLGEGTEDTRRRVVRSELGDRPEVADVVERFGEARLLSFDREETTREPTLEVAHEALLREWPRLRRWLDEDRDVLRAQRHLTEAAQSWLASGRDNGELYRGGRLETATHFTPAQMADLNENERGFLQASEELAEAQEATERRYVHRLRRSLIGVGVMLLLAILAGVVALLQRSEAQSSRDTAIEARAGAETRRMASNAIALVGNSPQLAALLAVEAHARGESADTFGALQRVLTGTDTVLGYVGTGRSYSAVLWLPGGSHRLVAADATGVDIHDLTGGSVRTLPMRFGGALAVSPDGERLALATLDGPVAVHAASDGALLAQLPHDSLVRSLEFNPDGELATGDREGWLRVWDGAGNLVHQRHAHPETRPEDVPEHLRPNETDLHETSTLPVGVTSLIWHPALDGWMTGGGIWLRQWDRELQPVSEIDVDRPRLTDTFVEGARRVAGRPTDLLVGEGATIHLGVESLVQTRDAVTGDLQAEFSPSQSNVLLFGDGSANFSLAVTGRTIVAAHDDRRVEEYDVMTGRATDVPAVIELDIVTGALALAISDDGRTIAVAGSGGVALLARDGRRILAKSLPREEQLEFSLSPDATWLAASSINSDAPMFWDLTTDPPVSFNGPNVPDAYRANTANFGSPIIVTLDGSILGFDPNGDLTEYQIPGGAFPESPTWSRDGKFTASGGFGLGTVFVRDGRTADLVAELHDLEAYAQFEGDGVSGVAFSADGTRLAAALSTGAAVVWDTATWTAIGSPMSEGGNTVHSLGYAPGGDILITSGAGAEITIRNALTSQPTGRTLIDPAKSDTRYAFGAFGFSDDGRFLVRASTSPAALFDLETDRQIGDAFPGEPGYEMLADVRGRYAITVIGDHVLVWDLNVDRWPDVACQFAGRNFSAEEWHQFGPSGEPYRPTCPQWPSQAPQEANP